MKFCITTGKVIPPFSKVCPFCGKVACLSNGKPLAIENRQDEILEIKSPAKESFSSGFANFDILLNGGFSPGNVCVLTARPGAGKTTYTLQIASFVANAGIPVLYYSGEMEESQMQSYLCRYQLSGKGIDFCHTATIDELLTRMRSGQYRFVILDSLQALKNGDYSRLSWSTQIGNITAIIKTAKRYGVAVLAISQVTKKGEIAGPNEISHDVDVVFEMECGVNGEVVVSSREKNRLNGDSDIRAVFRKTPKGLIPVTEIETGQIMRHSQKERKGVVSYPFFRNGEATTEEVTILALGQTKTRLQIVGKSTGAVVFLSAVLRKVVPEISLCYVIEANDVRKIDQSTDLAICIGVIASFLGKSIPVDSTFMGAVDGNGEILHVEGLERRAKRACLQGYTKVYGPCPIGNEYLTWIPCTSIRDVVMKLGWSIFVGSGEYSGSYIPIYCWRFWFRFVELSL
jgi:DNA repair protein RadA/Sms